MRYSSGHPPMMSRATRTERIGVVSHVLQTLVMLAAFPNVSPRAGVFKLWVVECVIITLLSITLILVLNLILRFDIDMINWY